MHNAAVALLHGWDPLAYLRAGSQESLERPVADAVLAQAVTMAAERRRVELEALARSIGACVANELSRILRT